MPIEAANAEESQLVISYLGLRKAIGVLGTALPFVLVLGNWVLGGHGVQPSISTYYYTGMRNVFVGILCAIGVFLMSYRGYERADDIAGDLGCAFAVGVALFPTTPPGTSGGLAAAIGAIHLTCAAAFFLVLAYFCLVLFVKTRADGVMTERKKQRNLVYRVCGWTILACVALVAIYFALLTHTPLRQLNPVLWLESAAVIAFGISWLTKGEAILADLDGK